MSLFYRNTNFKLVFLDTNALSYFVSNTNNFRNNFLDFLNNDNYRLSFNINNIMELKKGNLNRYNSFLENFSSIPCVLFKTYPSIIYEEVNYANTKNFNYSNISYSITPGYDLKSIIDNEVPDIDKYFEDVKGLLNFMNNLKEKYSKYAKFDSAYEIDNIKRTLKLWNLNLNKDIDLNNFPAIRMINKSFYNRIVNGKKEKSGRNDIHDIMISSVTPYIDIIVTERYQINVIKEAQKFIPQIQEIECYKVSDFSLK